MQNILRSFIGLGLFLMAAGFAGAQEVYFFTEATDTTYYDQGIVDVSNLGESTFEHAHPPGLPQYNDKIPASTLAFKGETSLKFNYTSAENGNWKAGIYRAGWSAANIEGLDSLAIYIYSESDIPSSALPLIALRARNKNGSGDATSQLYKLSGYNNDVPAQRWTRIEFPLNEVFGGNSNLNFSEAVGVVFSQSEKNGVSRLFYVDEIAAFKSIGEVPPVENLTATGYDSHAELNWDQPMEDLTYRIFASFDGGQAFGLRGETTENYYIDFVPEEGRNTSVSYRIVAAVQNKESEAVEAVAEIHDYSDDELLDLVQQYSFRYFWEGAHQPSGMILERSNGSENTAASGATGMGLMAMIVAHEREYEPRDSIKNRILKILNFLENCERHHGAWSHWYDAGTGKTRPFSPDDDGGDIVETSYVAQGLIALKNYFSGSDSESIQIREKSDKLWREIDWDWYRNGGQNVLYWHWSPNVGFQKNMKVRGWNEALVTYIMAASSPTHGIPKEVYTEGWALNGAIVNLREFYGYPISLAPDWGGPLFFIHYTHLGINPHELKDEYADYWQEHVNTAKIHVQYAIDNPEGHTNYSEKSWGLTASDDPFGYTAHAPVLNDNGTISPTAALSGFPYTPEESMKALKYFYRERGADLFGKYGPYDAFNDDLDWVQDAYIGIDQGPIVVMIENYRSGLLWNNVMNDADVQAGLGKLGFQYETSTLNQNVKSAGDMVIYPNPAEDQVVIRLPEIDSGYPAVLSVFNMDGKLIREIAPGYMEKLVLINCRDFRSGIYLVQLANGKKIAQAKLVIRK